MNKPLAFFWASALGVLGFAFGSALDAVVVPASAAPKLAKSVIVYTAPWCGACRLLETGLQERKIPFRPVDIEKDPGAFRQAQQATGASAIPLTNVISVGKDVWFVGVDLASVERAYRAPLRFFAFERSYGQGKDVAAMEGLREKGSGRWLRAFRTVRLAGSVGSSYVGGKFLDAFRSENDRTDAASQRHEVNARRILETLQDMRGPLMKVGQLLSTHGEALPGNYAGVLEALQAEAPPMGYEIVRRVIHDEFGAPPEQLFRDFSQRASAAASLGQVHQATLQDGTPVAVKVQYPGADAWVDGDLANLKLTASLTRRLLAEMTGQDAFDLTYVADEIAAQLVQELDYRQEAAHANLLGRLFENDPDVFVPRVYAERSSRRVICYDWVAGEDLAVGLNDENVARRERVVRQLLRALWHPLFHGGVMHADPHPGNFRLMNDGRLALFDFGCCKVFDESFLIPFTNMVRGELDRDPDAQRRAMAELGFFEGHGLTADLVADAERLAEFFARGLMREDVDFADTNYVQEARALVGHFFGHGRLPPAHKDFLFLTRVVLGYYEYFSRARVRMNFREVLAPYVRSGWCGRAVALPARAA